MKISIQDFRVGHQSYEGWQNGPNSAGGVSVKFNFFNLGDKTIKYATFGFIPYNSVNDAVCCSISRSSEQFVQYTGPLESNRWTGSLLFENVWYNNSISSVKLSKVYVQYMDGTSETIDGSDVPCLAPAGPCYVATAVYGSYDCPQVWTLRRYRDYTLAETWYGRTFIRTYYAISPTLVKWFGNTEWFKKMWKGKLDCLVANLNAKGVEDTPYEDRNQL